MKVFKTTAETKKGNFDVVIDVCWAKSPVTGGGFWDYKAVMVVDGKNIPVVFDRYKTDRVYASTELCNEWGIKWSHNLALKCDVSKAIEYTRSVDAKHRSELHEIYAKEDFDKKNDNY